MSNLGSIDLDLQAQISGLMRDFETAAHAIQDIGRRAEETRGQLGAMGEGEGGTPGLEDFLDSLPPQAAAAVAAFAGLGVAVKQLSEEIVELIYDFEEQDQANRALEDSLNRAGLQASFAKDRISEINTEIGELATLTNFGDEELLKMSATFIAMTGDANMTRKELELIADISVGMGKSGEEAAQVYAQALAGELEPELAKTTALTSKQVEAINELEDPTKRAETAFEALNSAFGGMAQNINPVLREMKNLEDAKGDLRQAAGELFAESEALEGIFSTLTQSLRGLETWLGNNEKAIGSFIDGGATVLQSLLDDMAGDVERLNQAFSLLSGQVGENEESFLKLSDVVRISAGVIENSAKSLRVGARPQYALLAGGVERLARGFRRAGEAAQEVDQSGGFSAAVRNALPWWQMYEEEMIQTGKTLTDFLNFPKPEPVEFDEDFLAAINGYSLDDEEATATVKPETEEVDMDDLFAQMRQEAAEAAAEAEEAATQEAYRQEILARRLELLRATNEVQAAEVELEIALLEIQKEGLEGLDAQLVLEQALLELDQARAAELQSIADAEEKAREKTEKVSDSAQDIGKMLQFGVSQADQLSGALLGAAGASDSLMDSVNGVISALGSAGQLAGGLAMGNPLMAIQGGVGLITSIADMVGGQGGGGGSGRTRTSREQELRDQAEEFAKAFVDEQEKRMGRPVVINLDARGALVGTEEEVARSLVGLVENELNNRVGGQLGS